MTQNSTHSHILLEPIHAHEAVSEGNGKILAALKFLERHKFFIVPTILRREYDLVHQHLIDLMNSLAEGPIFHITFEKHAG